MQQQGMTTAIVKYDMDNPTAAALYRSAGFSLKYNIMDYHKVM